MKGPRSDETVHVTLHHTQDHWVAEVKDPPQFSTWGRTPQEAVERLFQTLAQVEAEKRK